MHRQRLKIESVMYKTDVYMKLLAKCPSVTTMESSLKGDLFHLLPSERAQNIAKWVKVRISRQFF